MKNLFSITLISAVVILAECHLHSEVDHFLSECLKEYGIPELEGRPDFNDPKMKCPYACWMKKEGVLVDGKIVFEKDVEFGKKILPDLVTDEMKEIIKECVDKANEETDECEMANSLRRCNAEKFISFYGKTNIHS